MTRGEKTRKIAQAEQYLGRAAMLLVQVGASERLLSTVVKARKDLQRVIALRKQKPK